jgi:hypothetical protein
MDTTPVVRRALAGLVAATATVLAVQGCESSNDNNSIFTDGGGTGSGDRGGDDSSGTNRSCLGCGDSSLEATAACQGLQCQVNHTCSGGGHTTISGRVFDPGNRQPLYNVVVFVPIDPAGKLPPITPGTNSCNTCDSAIDNIVAAAITGPTGAFKIKDVPTGTNIPLVMQIGKWRREIFLPSTADCADTPVANTDTHLPRSQSEGDMPQMAILTGACDPLPCLFPRIGIDASEFTAPSGTGRMHVYKGMGGGDVKGGGAGNCTISACPLWSAKQNLEKYDIVLLSCECSTYDQTKTAPEKRAMHDWVNEGGKVFATHFHYTWFENGPPDFAAIANWTAGSLGPPYDVDTSFPKGMAFLQWLQYVGAMTGSSINLNPGDIRDSLSTVKAGALRWIYSPPSQGLPEHDAYFTFNTPIGGLPPSADAGADAGPSYCGKAVFSDIHVGGLENASTVPTTCDSAPLTAQEKALEFLFFDLSSCVQNDQQPPQPPQPQ